MAGYWPSSFFACLWAHILAKTIEDNLQTISSHLDLTNLVNKAIIISISGKCFFAGRGW